MKTLGLMLSALCLIPVLTFGCSDDSSDSSDESGGSGGSAGADPGSGGSGVQGGSGGGSAGAAPSTGGTTGGGDNPCGTITLNPGDPVTIPWEGDLSSVTYPTVTCDTVDPAATMWNLRLRDGADHEVHLVLNLFNATYPTLGDLEGHGISLAQDFGDGGATALQVTLTEWSSHYVAEPDPTVFIQSIGSDGIVGCISGFERFADTGTGVVTTPDPIAFACTPL